MSDEIKVGDRVRGQYTRNLYTVLAIHNRDLWGLPDGQSIPTTLTRNCVTRINPEPVTLTPKYKVGEEVKDGGGCVFNVEECAVSYRDDTDTWFVESDLSSLSKPCDKCGK